MNGAASSSLLRPVLRIFGLIFIFGIPLFNRIWPSGWAWAPEQPAYLQMIWGIYATLAARNVSLIWFTVWSSIVHGAVMAVHSVTDPGQIGHLWGDVAALFLTAVVLTVLVRRELPVGSRA